MLMKKIILVSLIQLSTFANNVVAQFKGGVGRSGFGQTVINNQAYIFGGLTSENGNTQASADLIILDLRKSFNLSDIPWSPKSGPQKFPPPVIGNTLFLHKDEKNDPYFSTFGGQIPSTYQYPSGNSSNSLFLCKLSDNSWSIENRENMPSSRVFSSASLDEGMGTAIIFGGAPASVDGTIPLGISGQALSDLYQVNVQTLQWQKLSITGCKLDSHIGHTATRLSSGEIIILGGSNGTSLYSMRSAFVIDPRNAFCAIKNLGGVQFPDDRIFHASDLTNDGRIILSGGTDGRANIYGDWWILDTKSWKWTQIVAAGAPDVPAPRFRHTLTVSGNNVLSFFGALNLNETLLDDRIYNYNLQTGQFTQRFDPPASNQSLSAGAIAGIVIGSLVLLGGVVLGALYITLRHRRKNSDKKFESNIFQSEPIEPESHIGTIATQSKADQHSSYMDPRVSHLSAYTSFTDHLNPDGKHESIERPLSVNTLVGSERPESMKPNAY
ncbi:uncharacterized protein VTP21DRAFT_6320 [Calcarisporiella thermophila]|uniref:uncharacterized protein n=1 Tax=Calcarisporiella thermophila TaxID=911321 RepID=UPI003744373F